MRPKDLALRLGWTFTGLVGVFVADKALAHGLAWALRQIPECALFRELLEHFPFSAARVCLAVSTLSNGESPLAQILADSISESVLFGIGVGLLFFARKHGWFLLTVGAVFICGYTLTAIAQLPLSAERLEESGVGFLVSGFTPNGESYQKALELLPYLIRAGVISLGILPLIGAFALVRLKQSLRGRRLAALVLIAFALLAPALPPDKSPAKSLIPVPVATTVEYTPQIISFSATVVPPTATISPAATETKVTKPSYRIRAVHYFFGNMLNLPREVRLKILRRDLSLIQGVGFNGVSGWEEAGFDADFLELAQQLGLWVIKPLALQTETGQDALIQSDFTDPAFRLLVKETVLQKIAAQKSTPAILYWNLGADEPLEKMKNYYHRSAEQLQAAANLIVELALLIHQVDPQHKVIVSEPQDWYLSFYQEALARVKNEINPAEYFIIGGNFYGHPDTVRKNVRRTQQEVSKLGVTFAVTEWAPFGVEKEKLPQFRVQISRDLEKFTAVQIAYVFNPAADPLNVNVADPSQSLITGLAMTDLERNETEVLKALREAWKNN